MANKGPSLRQQSNNTASWLMHSVRAAKATRTRNGRTYTAAAFGRLNQLDGKTTFLNWTKIMRDKSHHTANVFTNIMRRVVRWLKPSYKVPSPGSMEAITYTREGLILRDYMLMRSAAACLLIEKTVRADTKLLRSLRRRRLATRSYIRQGFPRRRS
jgi:hypothetical protein